MNKLRIGVVFGIVTFALTACTSTEPKPEPLKLIGIVNGFNLDSASVAQQVNLSVSAVKPDGNLLENAVLLNPNVPLGSVYPFTVSNNIVGGTAYKPTKVTATTCGSISGISSGAIAAVIALDATGSMSTNDPIPNSNKTQTSRNAASKLFVNRMSVSDTALIGSFSSGGDFPATSPNLALKLWQDFSSDKILLGTAIDNATSENGGTNLWDAAYDSVKLAMTQTAPNKMAIVLTDGEDNSSMKTPTEVIALAKANGIKVHMVGLAITNADMLKVSSGTGGTYSFAGTPLALKGAFNGIFNSTQGAGCIKLAFEPPVPEGVFIRANLNFTTNNESLTTSFLLIF